MFIQFRLHIATYSAFFVLLSMGASALASESPPNILLVMTDDQGYGDLGCHGHPYLKTPNLDKLHQQSTRFTDFHVSPTCAPTRSALMSGRHPFKNGVTHTILERERMALSAITIAEVLKSAGYTTGVFGKWHLGDESPYQPQNRGFDESFIHGCGGIGQSYPGSQKCVPGNSYFDPVIRHNGQFVKTKGYCTDVFFQQTLSWIKNVKGKKPFFAYLATNAPHGPFIVADQYKEPYKDKPGKNADAFYGMIANIDENMGILMNKLDEWHLRDNTLLIFMTDNGSARGTWNAGMRGMKNSPYQGGARVPLFMRLPGTTTAGVDIDRLTRHVDLYPTLAELAGATLPEKYDLDGRSLMPLIKDPKAEWSDRMMFFHIGRWKKAGAPGNWGQGDTTAASHKYKGYAVRNEQWRLVNGELYDINNDPGESTNVADQHPEVAANLKKSFDEWWDTVQPLLVNEAASLDAHDTFKAAYEKQASEGPIPEWNSPNLD